MGGRGELRSGRTSEWQGSWASIPEQGEDTRYDDRGSFQDRDRERNDAGCGYPDRSRDDARYKDRGDRYHRDGDRSESERGYPEQSRDETRYNYRGGLQDRDGEREDGGRRYPERGRDDARYGDRGERQHGYGWEEGSRDYIAPIVTHTAEVGVSLEGGVGIGAEAEAHQVIKSRRTEKVEGFIGHHKSISMIEVIREALVTMTTATWSVTMRATTEAASMEMMEAFGVITIGVVGPLAESGADIIVSKPLQLPL